MEGGANPSAGANQARSSLVRSLRHLQDFAKFEALDGPMRNMQSSPNDPRSSPSRSLKTYVHPVLGLFVFNVMAIAVLAPRLTGGDIVVGLLLPLGFLWMLSGTLRAGTISTNHGILTRWERPIAFRVAVTALVLAYVAMSSAPFYIWTTGG